jgi:hypothetical protein
MQRILERYRPTAWSWPGMHEQPGQNAAPEYQLAVIHPPQYRADHGDK